MTRRYNIYKNCAMLWPMAFCMMCCALCGVLVSCSSDDEAPDDNQGSKLHLISCTRAIDDDYNFIDGTKLWLALTSGTTKDSEGSYTYNNSTELQWTWTNGITVREAKQYYLYGVMLPPRSAEDNPTIGITSTDYSKGATLTISGVSPMLNESDVPSVVVGARGVLDPSTEWAVTEGQFGYMGILKKNQDNAQLLLDRLYAGLTFSFTIDEKYSALRTIKLTSLKLKASATTYDKVNLTVVLEARTNGTSPIKSVSATATSTSPVEDVTLFTDTDGQDIKDPLTGMGTACFASSIASNLSVECEYDVYDKPTTGDPQHKLAHRTAVNSLSNVISAGSLLQGQKRTIQLNVVPTYLYILSDADLDNPVITVN